MLYLPFRLRDITEQTVPIGPSFSKARQVILNVNENLLSLKMPRHKPKFSAHDQYNINGLIDIDNAKLYMEEPSVGKWRKSVLIHRAWRFNGPWFSGVLGEVSSSVVLYNCRYTQGESLFNPEQLEKELCELLTVQYSDEKWHGVSSWRAPDRWQAHKDSPVPTVSYNIQPVFAGNFQKHFVLPIRDDAMIILSFRQKQSMTGDIAERDERIDRKNMEQLCQDIINSTELKLSPQSQAQLQAAQQAHPGAALSSHVEPLVWTTEEDDKAHAKYKAAHTF